jgi:hypothetical protein
MSFSKLETGLTASELSKDYLLEDRLNSLGVLHQLSQVDRQLQELRVQLDQVQQQLSRLSSQLLRAR